MSRMIISAPQDGLVVLKTIWKGTQMGEVQEGEEIRPGTPIVEVVDPSQMRVRARVNQADVPLLRAGARLDQAPCPRTAARPQQPLPGGTFRVDEIPLADHG
jgi:multidrug efflux pump subunit AcrA (membrane-fusion protein)